MQRGAAATPAPADGTTTTDGTVADPNAAATDASAVQ